MAIKITLSLLTSFLLVGSLANAAPTEAEQRNNCETKKEASACFSTGFTELKKNEPTSRRSAAKLLMRACALQKKKKECSKSEAKIAARNYLARDRVPAAAGPAKITAAPGVKTIKAPKIQNPSKSTPSTYTPPAFEPPQQQQPYEPQPEPMAPPPMPYIPQPPPMPPPIPQPPDGSFTTEPMTN